MEEQTVQPRLVEFDPQSLDQATLDELIRVYEAGYGERWIGKDRFLKETMPNTSIINALVVGKNIAAAVNINTNRIITISVDPKFQGLGYGVELFRQVAQRYPDVWISIGIDAQDMLATITSYALNFQPVDDPREIERLYRGLKGVPQDFSVETSEVVNDFLSERLTKKGMIRQKFVVFKRSGSLHDSAYKQILFQNQG